MFCNLSGNLQTTAGKKKKQQQQKKNNEKLYDLTSSETEYEPANMDHPRQTILCLVTIR